MDLDDFIKRKYIFNKIDSYEKTLDTEHYMAFYNDFRGKSLEEVKKMLKMKYIPDETKRTIRFYLLRLEELNKLEIKPTFLALAK